MTDIDSRVDSENIGILYKFCVKMLYALENLDLTNICIDYFFVFAGFS